MKACIACKHMEIEEGFMGSSWTGWCSGHVKCAMGKFYESDPSTGELIVLTMSMAQDCESFELSELAREKGWEDPTMENKP